MALLFAWCHQRPIWLTLSRGLYRQKCIQIAYERAHLLRVGVSQKVDLAEISIKFVGHNPKVSHHPMFAISYRMHWYIYDLYLCQISYAQHVIPLFSLTTRRQRRVLMAVVLFYILHPQPPHSPLQKSTKLFIVRTSITKHYFRIPN